jgi:hypothetical protein
MVEGAPFSDLTRSKLALLLELSEAAFPLWKRFENAWGEEVTEPDVIGEATQAFSAIHDAAKAWLETGAVDAEELQAHVDSVDEGASEAGENSQTEIGDQAVAAEVAAVAVETLAWALGRLAGVQIIGESTPDPDGGSGMDGVLEMAEREPEIGHLRELWSQFAAP